MKALNTKPQQVLFVIMMLVATTSCIPSYKGISTQEFAFAEQNKEQELSIICADTLLFGKQKKYSFCPVKIENKDVIPFLINSKSITVFSDYEQVRLVDSKAYHKSIRKKYWGYTVLACVGAIPRVIHSSDGTQVMGVNPIGLVAVGIAGFYIFKTIRHNKMQKRDLRLLDLNGQSIAPGETKTGLLVLDKPNCKNISIRIE